MSLLVNTYTRGQSGDMVCLDPPNSWEELAGPESYRQKFYGSVAAKSLGLEMLPSLSSGDLYVESIAGLEMLQREAQQMLDNLGLFTSEAGADYESLRPRILNILAAVQRAIDVNGCVVIW
ncbi:MAG TPA: hypothetical protein VM510_15900 [Caulifigura sp.]|jgi:hypothetical protein|nr:hypothetical protein [Caulifigura sp.]